LTRPQPAPTVKAATISQEVAPREGPDGKPTRIGRAPGPPPYTPLMALHGDEPYADPDKCWGCGLDGQPAHPNGRNLCPTCAELRQLQVDTHPLWHGFDPAGLAGKDPPSKMTLIRDQLAKVTDLDGYDDLRDYLVEQFQLAETAQQALVRRRAILADLTETASNPKQPPPNCYEPEATRQNPRSQA